jgi:hypothetical protein
MAWPSSHAHMRLAGKKKICQSKDSDFSFSLLFFSFSDIVILDLAQVDRANSQFPFVTQ